MKARAWMGAVVAAGTLLAAGCGGGAAGPGGSNGAISGGTNGNPTTPVASGTLTPAAPPVVQLGQSQALGSILTNGAGMTLYLYTKDSPNQSNCNGSCATLWPPLSTSLLKPTGAPGVQAAIGVIGRADGTKQVTINGHPVYTYVKDQRPGDATGQGVGSAWYALTPSGDAAGTPPASSATVQVANDPHYGKILVDAKGMTLYLYTKDAPGASTCVAGCATLWPPLTAAAAPTAGPGVTGPLTLITRTDGSKQVAINGQPLYTYAGDKNSGDTTGQGVGSVWWVVKPNGAENGMAPAGQ